MSESQKSEKKRKRQSDGAQKPRKKTAVSEPSRETVKVVHHQYNEDWIPVVASTPGLFLPAPVTFATYRKLPSKDNKESELLLHSTTHRSLNYTARETSNTYLKHHIGIYDPATQKLQLIPAHHVSVRSTVRSEEEAARATAIAQRKNRDLTASQALQVAFGSKKAKKAIQALSDNAITPTKAPRDLSPGAIQKAIRQDPTAASVLETIAESAATAPDRASQQAAIDAAKPRPPHNPDATEAKEVYPPDEVIGHDMLVALKVKGWADTIAGGGDVVTSSRFVSRRIAEIVRNNDVLRLKVAKYVLVLTMLANTLRRTKEGGIANGKLPKREILREKMDGVGEWVLNQVIKKYTHGGEISKWQVDNLLAHIFVCTLIVDQFETDTTNIREDLRLTVKDSTKYFREVGATVDSLTDTERSRMNLTKEEANDHRIARLPVPPRFPKQRQIPQRR